MIKIETNVRFKTELSDSESPLLEPVSTATLMDNVLQARDRLFEVKLSDGLAAHRKLIELLPK
jgi:hypothetical protein